MKTLRPLLLPDQVSTLGRGESTLSYDETTVILLRYVALSGYGFYCRAEWAIDPWSLWPNGLIVLVSPS